MRTKDGQGNDEERRLQREVLALALVEHPLRLTLRDVGTAIGQPLEVEQAVAALVEAGLLRLEGEELVPTAAAVRFHEIEPIEPPGER